MRFMLSVAYDVLNGTHRGFEPLTTAAIEGQVPTVSDEMRVNVARERESPLIGALLARQCVSQDSYLAWLVAKMSIQPSPSQSTR